MSRDTHKRKLDSPSTTLPPHKRRRARAFQYDELPDGHIRILQVTSELKRSGRRSLTTQLRSFPVSRLPHFIALSYAWPQPGSPVRKIECNGKAITVFAHIYTAFENLCPTASACSLAIWIDAVCIDQENKIEKKKQVSKMGSIYGLAGQVIAWLGPNPLVKQYRDEIENLARRKDFVESLERERLYGWQHFSFREHHTALSEAIHSFLCSSWFTRLWIVQEVCLGRYVSVLCDACVVPWDFLRVFFDWQTTVRTWHASLHFDVVKGFEGGHAIAEAKAVMKSYQEMNDHPARDFLGMIKTLDFLRSRLVLKPIDRVFGLMFILPEGVRTQIVVDYSHENEFWKAYVCLTRILLPHRMGLSVLSLAISEDRNPTLPSWCPDWNTPTSRAPEQIQEVSPEGSGGARQHLPGIRFGDDLRHLQVRGFRIDRIATSMPGLQADIGSLDDREVWWYWQRQCLDTVNAVLRDRTDVNANLRMHLSNLVLGSRLFGRDLHSGLSNNSNRRADLVVKRIYQELLSFLEGPHNPDKSCAEMTGKAYAIFENTHRTRSYFFTENGRVGRGCHQDQSGDFLVVLYSAAVPFILRYDEGSNVATLIGDAYLYGCMDLDSMPFEGRGPDEWFTIG